MRHSHHSVVFLHWINRRSLQTLGRQMLRSGTSGWGNTIERHIADALAAEFISKIEGGLQELDETAYWIELLVESKPVPAAKVAQLLNETEQLLSIFVASVKTSKQKRTP